jgi:hypothetical protein
VTLAGPALVSMLLAAGPSVLVVPANAASRGICEDLLETLANATFRVKLAGERSDAVKCVARKGAARASCLAEAEGKARVEAALLVTAVRKGPQTVVAVQVVGRAGEPVHLETFRAPRPRLAQAAKAPLERVLASVKAVASAPVSGPLPRLEPRPPPVEAPATRLAPAEPPLARAVAPEPQPPAEDAPRVTPALQPPVVSQAPDLVASGPPPVVRRSPVAGWVVLGVAVLAAGVAGTFTGLAVADRGRLGAVSLDRSELSYTQAVQLRDRANLEFSIALGTGIGAAALGTTAGLLWLE